MMRTIEQEGKHNNQILGNNNIMTRTKQVGKNLIGNISNVRDVHNGDNINITINLYQAKGETKMKTDSNTAIRTIAHAITRSEIPLIALNHITSEHRLKYFKDLDKADMPHNLDMLFEELGTVYNLLREENEGLREYKLDLEAEGKRNVQ